MISTIRDYLDVLSGILNTSHSYFDIVQVTFIFFFQSFLSFFQYIVTFGWFRDIMYLPIIIPKCQQLILSEHFFYEGINLNVFQTLLNTQASQGVLGFFVLGFLNSLFCCLPLSTTHLLATRRLFVQGLVAGIASTAGIIVGQCAFICFTIFGVRSAIIPWLSLDPLNYILGIILLFSIVYEMANEKRIRPIDSSEKQILRNIFFISILLTWTEQANISQYLTNLTLSNQPSLLTLGGPTSSWLSHFSYCIGIFVGHICFSVVFIGLSMAMKNSLFTLSKLPYSVWLKRANIVFLVGIIGLSFSSTPYYGLDYLLTGPLGFISQDKVLDNSIFSQRNIKDPSRLLTSMDVIFPFSIDTDISYFDRGDYGEQPGFFKRNFEELNYQGEYAWLVRRDKKPNLYSSAQTTRTTIRDLFQFDQNDTNLTNTQREPSNDNSKANDQLARATKSAKKMSYQASFAKKPGTGDRDRLKLKKRYEENYEESRANETYLIGESFNNFPQIETTLTPLETALKQKYYTNRVYKALLNVEIDAFLNRQPKSYQLGQDEENEVFQKRYLLAKYHDTIRAYQQLPYKDEFNEFFQGSKTFVDRAYNHQFKGNLGVLRRLFAVTLDSEENPAKLPVLKYDQPLFSNENGNQFMHEELSLNELNPMYTPNGVQGRDIYNNLFEVSNSQQSSEVTVEGQTNLNSGLANPFLELNDSTPFYLGWDNETRQMVLTKRFMPTTENIYFEEQEKMTGSEFQKFLQEAKSDSSNEDKRGLTFTTWPLQKDSLMNLKSRPNNQVITLFEPTTNPEMMSILKIISATRGGNVEIFSFPANMRFFNKTPEHLVPNQGGFMWPGSQYQYVVSDSTEAS